MTLLDKVCAFGCSPKDIEHIAKSINSDLAHAFTFRLLTSSALVDRNLCLFFQILPCQATSREGITQISSACKDLRRLIDPVVCSAKSQFA